MVTGGVEVTGLKLGEKKRHSFFSCIHSRPVPCQRRSLSYRPLVKVLLPF